MNYADIRKYDTSNWLGINSTIFFSGCNFHCKGCFNKEAQDFNYGKPYTKEVEDLLICYARNEHVTGVCLLGGEVFQQDLNVILNLVKRINKEVNKPIYIWTGYLWDKLIQDEKKIEILKYVDVLIDGQFQIDKKNLNLKFRGSSNQRVIDVKKSFKNNKIILWENENEIS